MYTIPTRCPTLLALLCLSAAAIPAQAVTRIWPGSAPCGTTLQACINGSSNGDRIEIASNIPINESLSVLDRSLELVAANGFRPKLVEGRDLRIASTAVSAAPTVVVDGIQLLRGTVSASYDGVGTASYTIRNMVVFGSSGGSNRSITVGALNGTLNLTLYNNRVRCDPDVNVIGGIAMSSRAATTFNAKVHNNTIVCSTQGSSGIVTVIGSGVAGSADATLQFHGNEIRVEPSTGSGSPTSGTSGIFLQESIDATTPSTISAQFYNNVLAGNGFDSSGVGISASVNDGDMDLQVTNNTITGWGRSLGAFSVFGPGSVTSNIDGMIANNVMVSSGDAIFLEADTTAGLSNDYNLVNAPTIGTTLGPNSITAPARLVSESTPRLRSDSPAIDAGNYATLVSAIASAALPETDADGLRRFKGTANAVDIGAYEFGDVSFEHRVTESGSNITRIYSAALDGVASAIPQASLLKLPGVANYFGPYALYYPSSAWHLFDEAIAPLPLGTGFNVFVPANGSGVLRYVATPASITSYATRINIVGLNNNPDAILLATQNWQPNLVYNPHPISVAYAAGAWYIDNNDQAAMPANAAFNLYWQPPSPNAFPVTASSANLLLGSLRVNHPLLDGNPCARPQATRMTFGTSTRTKTATWRYASGSGEWYLDDDGFINPMPVGTQFNVVVDPAQVALCTDRIFANDF